MEGNSSQSFGSNFRIIPGKQRNSKVYVKEPFTYVIDRWAQNPVDKQPVLYLKCRFPACLARAVIIDDFLSTTVSKHAHTCNESESIGMAKITALEITNKMKMRAELELTSFYQIYHEELVGQTEAVRGLFTFSRLRKIMAEARKIIIPPTPDSMADAISKFELTMYPQVFQNMYLGSTEYKEYVGNGTYRKFLAFILVNKDVVEKMCQESTFFFMDGSFRVSPRQGKAPSCRSSQVFNILADHDGKVVPVFNVIMECRKTGLYQEVFKKITSVYENFKPQQVMANFEAGLRKGFMMNFPDSRIFGCRYEFAKALFHKLKSKFHLGSFYKPRGSALQKRISNLLRQYFGLSLLKVNHMKAEVERLERELRHLTKHVSTVVAERLNKFHLYVVDLWMRLFGPKNLSVAGAQYKINTIAERFHGQLDRDLPDHPNIFNLMISLRNTAYPNAIPTIPLVGKGRPFPGRRTLAVQKLQEKSEWLELEYMNGLISASDLLMQVADHYNDEELYELFVIDAEVLDEQAFFPDDDEIGACDDPTLREAIDEDERVTLLVQDEGLTDMDGQEWERNKWTVSSEKKKVEDAVIVCSICLDDPNYQCLLVQCGHSFCLSCIARPDMKVCPLCKVPRKEVVRFNVHSLMIVDKKEVARGFGYTQSSQFDDEEVQRIVKNCELEEEASPTVGEEEENAQEEETNPGAVLLETIQDSSEGAAPATSEMHVENVNLIQEAILEVMVEPVVVPVPGGSGLGGSGANRGSGLAGSGPSRGSRLERGRSYPGRGGARSRRSGTRSGEEGSRPERGRNRPGGIALTVKRLRRSSRPRRSTSFSPSSEAASVGTYHMTPIYDDGRVYY